LNFSNLYRSGNKLVIWDKNIGFVRQSLQETLCSSCSVFYGIFFPRVLYNLRKVNVKNIFNVYTFKKKVPWEGKT